MGTLRTHVSRNAWDCLKATLTKSRLIKIGDIVIPQGSPDLRTVIICPVLTCHEHLGYYHKCVPIDFSMQVRIRKH